MIPIDRITFVDPANGLVRTVRHRKEMEALIRSAPFRAQIWQIIKMLNELFPPGGSTGGSTLSATLGPPLGADGGPWQSTAPVTHQRRPPLAASSRPLG